MKKLFIICVLLLIAGCSQNTANSTGNKANATDENKLTQTDVIRLQDVKALSTALNQYLIENKVPEIIEKLPACNRQKTLLGSGDNRVDISFLVPTFLSRIPTDPKPDNANKGYALCKNGKGQFVFWALTSESGQEIKFGN